jgi:hypothetical protein
LGKANHPTRKENEETNSKESPQIAGSIFMVML